MKSAAAHPKRRPGRPLSFDRETALDLAMRQFWSTGYETTSIADLTKAMGITAPSLYTAFHDKEALFLECVARYSNPGPKTTAELIAEAPSARQAARTLLETAAQWFTQPGTPAGCLVASAASTGSVASRKVRAALRQVRQETQVALQKRAEQDVRAGYLPKTAKPKALAAMTMAVVQGMSTLARDGAERDLLHAVVQTSLAAWPLSEC